MTTTAHPLIAVVNDRFGGVITRGDHAPDGAVPQPPAEWSAGDSPWLNR